MKNESQHTKVNRSDISYLKAFLLPALWIALITAGSFVPSAPDNINLNKIPGADKMLHGFFYLILVLLLMRGALRRFGSLDRTKIIGILAAVIFYGFLIEICQHLFFPSRHFEILDIIANIIGSLIGYLIFNRLINKK